MSKKNPSVVDYFDLTRFISRVLELAQGEPSNIHPDFRA